MKGIDWRTVEVPKQMRSLPKDRRGFPIPFIVMIDKAKRPHFPVSDQGRVGKAIRGRLCAICGKRMGAEGWFIGGPGSFLSRSGAFLDPPTHEECGRYAARVCPYLAAPNYARRIDDRNLKPDAMPEGYGIATEPVLDERPEFFMLASAATWEARPGNAEGMTVLRPTSPWYALEIWREGVLVGPDETAALLVREMAKWTGEALG